MDWCAHGWSRIDGPGSVVARKLSDRRRAVLNQIHCQLNGFIYQFAVVVTHSWARVNTYPRHDGLSRSRDPCNHYGWRNHIKVTWLGHVDWKQISDACECTCLDGEVVTASNWRSRGPRFKSHSRITSDSCSRWINWDSHASVSSLSTLDRTLWNFPILEPSLCPDPIDIQYSDLYGNPITINL